MTYQVYAFAPDAELIDELDELDEAIARCEELVHEDGYPVAEIWDAAGDRVHSVGRGGDWTRGASRPDAAATSDAAPRFGFAEEVAAREPDGDTAEPEAASGDDGGTFASPGPAPTVTVPPSPDAEGAARTSRPQSVIADAAAAPVQWFGA
jgi:hypothetical protein